MDKRLLKAAMCSRGDICGTLAQAMGISKSTLSAKMNGHSDFVQSEIAFIKARYGLSAEQIDAIFFN